MVSSLEQTIENAWEQRTTLGPGSTDDAVFAVAEVMTKLDRGELRVAELDTTGSWTVRQWIKKAVLLSFRLNPMDVVSGGPVDTQKGPAVWWDKVPSKFAGWDASRFRDAALRAVPGAIVRHSAFIGRDVVLMPCFVNVGAYVGAATMIDTFSTVGSCAQIGANCHISGGVGIGGVLEPLQSDPVIIEDDCFIGARSEVAEGVRVERGAVLSMGVFLGASTKIIDRSTGEIFIGRVPSYSVVVPGSLPGKALSDGSPGPSLYCAVIVKRVDAQTRAKTSINDLLRA